MRRLRSLVAVCGAGLLALACTERDGEEAPQEPARGPVLEERTARPAEAEECPWPAPDEWPIFRGNQALHGAASGSLARDFELLWSHATGEPVLSSAVVAGGRVYVGGDDGKLHALELESGKPVWSYATEEPIEAPPLFHEGRVYVGSLDYALHAVDAESGELAWKFETEGDIKGSANWARLPGEEQSRILVASLDNNLYCLDAASGAKLWVYASDHQLFGTPAVHGERAVIGGCDTMLHVASIRDGSSIAKYELGCHIKGSIALTSDSAYLGHNEDAFICVDLKSGELRWSRDEERSPFLGSPAIEEQLLLIGGSDRLLHCVRRASGEPLWQLPARRKIESSPVICGDKVVFGSSDGILRVASLGTGEELWSYEIGKAIAASPAVAGGKIVVGAMDGRIYAFGPSGG